MPFIKPTVGRIVHYRPGPQDPTPQFKNEPLAAIVTRVISDQVVNLTVLRADGITYGRHNVDLVQSGSNSPVEPYCHWMDYQIGQAAKTEQLEAELAKKA